MDSAVLGLFGSWCVKEEKELLQKAWRTRGSMLLDILISVACEYLENICEAVKVPFHRRMLTYMTADLIDRLSNCKNATGLYQTTTVNISVHSLRFLSMAAERM